MTTSSHYKYIVTNKIIEFNMMKKQETKKRTNLKYIYIFREILSKKSCHVNIQQSFRCAISSGRLTIALGVEYLDAAHGAYALLVGALLAIVRARLVHHLLANATLLER